APRMLASTMVDADPRRFPVAIFLMNFGTSMCVGHAAVQGASKQYRQRLASTSAACGSNGGCISVNRRATSSAGYNVMPAASRLHHRSVHVGTAIAEELPCLADLADQVQIQVGGQDCILIA